MNTLTKNLFKKLILVSLTVVLVACGGKEERKAAYLEKGKVYLEEGNLDKAKIEFKNVIQIDPKYAEAYYYMARVEELSKNLPKSLSHYKKAIELNKGFTDAKVKLSKIYVIAGTEELINSAEKLLSEVKAEQPNNTEAEFIEATIKYKKGKKIEATKDLEIVLGKDPSLVEGISLLASIYVANGDEEKAIKLLKKTVDSNTGNVTLRITLAKLLAKHRKYIEAESYLKQAVAIKPEKYSLQVALASFYASSGQVDKAEKVLKKGISQKENDAQRYLVLIEMLASRKGVKYAEDELLKAIKDKPDLIELKFSQARFYEKIAKPEKAKRVLEKIILENGLDVNGVKARNILSNILLKEGDKSGAKKYVDEVVAEYPNNNDATLIGSKLALMNKDIDTAINGFRTILKNDPKNVEAAMLLARAHVLNDEDILAENVLKKAIEDNPLNEKSHVNYAAYLISKKRMNDALSVSEKALAYFRESYDLMRVKLKALSGNIERSEEIAFLLNKMESKFPDKADVNILKGKFLLSKGKVQRAIEEFKKAYEKAQNKFIPLELLTKAYVYNKQRDKAFRYLGELLRSEPNNASVLQVLGQLYLSEKNYSDARMQFKKAINSNADWLLPYTSIANSYLMEKNYKEAIAEYRRALLKAENKMPIQLKLVSIYEKQGSFSEAISVYKEMIKDHPKNKLVVNNYASLLLDHGKESDVSKALELVKDFASSSQVAFQDTLAWALAKSGDNAKAIEILSPIVNKLPEVAIFQYHLGYALYYSGDKSSAKLHLNSAVESKQNFTGKQNARVLLGNI